MLFIMFNSFIRCLFVVFSNDSPTVQFASNIVSAVVSSLSKQEAEKC